MKGTSIRAALAMATALAVSGGALPAAAKAPGSHKARPCAHDALRTSMTDFVRLLVTERDPKDAYEKYASPEMVNHNMRMGPDRASVIAANEKILNTPGSTFTVRDVLVDGNMTVLRYDGVLDPAKPGAQVVEFFRWQDGRIVEHWDLFQLQPKAGEAARGGSGQ